MSEYEQTDPKQSGENVHAPINLGRHQAQCSICRHPQRQEIEEAWVGWGYPGQIAKDFDISRDAVYRHAHATNLFAKRRANLKVICEKVLERVDRTQFTGSNFMSMLRAYMKINLAENEAEAAQRPDPKAPQPDATQQMEASTRDGSLANLVAETVGDLPVQSLSATQEHQEAEDATIQQPSGATEEHQEAEDITIQ